MSMRHSDFTIGLEFTVSGSNSRWRCTDIGTRTICAIRLDKGEDTSWYNGPPYAVLEHCFDEDAIETCDNVSAKGK